MVESAVEPPKVAFATVGCRLNQAESDSMAEQLGERGIVLVDGEARPDVVVINTCTVTREATKASRSAIRRAVKDNLDARIVVTGCYAMSDPAEVEAIEGVDMIVCNDDKERFGEVLGAAPLTRPLLQIGLGPATIPSQQGRVRANLKVQTGCDEWCTFCIIPRTRGPLRSLEEESLIQEARSRVAAGAREIVLTGVHLGKYAYDQGGDERRLVKLLSQLLSIEGLWRLRLSSILSRHLTDDLISFMSAEPRICRYLHVPLQSGDDEVLERMNRPYRRDEFVEACEGAKEALPGLALATDIIVGFPGESDAAFAATMEVTRRLRFTKLHVFRYSSRPGTPAAEMDGEVHPDVKRARSKALIGLGNELRGDFLRSHLGRPLEVLVEDERVIDGLSVCSGQTDDHVRVWFEGEGLLGAMVDVQGEQIRADGIREARLLRVTRPAETMGGRR